MKWLAWGLLAANLVAVGFFVGRSHWPATDAAQFAPLNVERLSLRGQADVPTRQPAVAPAPLAAPAQALCVEWRGLTVDEFARVRDQLKAMAAERVMSFTEVPLNTRHWVIFPPLPSPQSATTKLGELAAAGVQDAFVVKDGPWRNAISLGLYANAEATGRRLRELEGKGVLGTHVEVLPRQGTAFYFVIRSEDPDALKSLSGIGQAYPNSQQSRVACPS